MFAVPSASLEGFRRCLGQGAIASCCTRRRCDRCRGILCSWYTTRAVLRGRIVSGRPDGWEITAGNALWDPGAAPSPSTRAGLERLCSASIAMTSCPDIGCTTSSCGANDTSTDRFASTPSSARNGSRSSRSAGYRCDRLYRIISATSGGTSLTCVGDGIDTLLVRLASTTPFDDMLSNFRFGATRLTSLSSRGSSRFRTRRSRCSSTGTSGVSGWRRAWLIVLLESAAKIIRHIIIRSVIIRGVTRADRHCTGTRARSIRRRSVQRRSSTFPGRRARRSDRSIRLWWRRYTAWSRTRRLSLRKWVLARTSHRPPRSLRDGINSRSTWTALLGRLSIRFQVDNLGPPPLPSCTRSRHPLVHRIFFLTIRSIPRHPLAPPLIHRIISIIVGFIRQGVILLFLGHGLDHLLAQPLPRLLFFRLFRIPLCLALPRRRGDIRSRFRFRLWRPLPQTRGLDIHHHRHLQGRLFQSFAAEHFEVVKLCRMKGIDIDPKFTVDRRRLRFLLRHPWDFIIARPIDQDRDRGRRTSLCIDIPIDLSGHTLNSLIDRRPPDLRRDLPIPPDLSGFRFRLFFEFL